MSHPKTLFAILLLTSLLGCGGGGGGSSPPVFPPPLAVEATSYGNKHDIVLDSPQVTALTGSDGRTVAFGDFFQEGEYSAFVTVTVGSSREARFLKKSGSSWTDHTQSLLLNGAAITVCNTVAQALTADFNGDGKPDVFLVCGMSAASDQHIVMSQSGTTSYARQAITNSAGQAIQLQGWGGAAADIDGDGDIDIVMAQNNELVVLENKIKSNGYWVLHNTANQNAWIDLATLNNFPTMPRKVFLIPRSGARPDLVVGGDGSVGNITLAWMQGLTTGTAPFYRFNENTAYSSYANAYRMINNNSGSIYDVVKIGSDLLVLAKDQSLVNESNATQMVLLRHSLPNLGSGASVSYTGNSAPNFISQFKLISSGRLLAYDGACVSGETRCSFTASP
jgi:hypothetical protein